LTGDAEWNLKQSGSSETLTWRFVENNELSLNYQAKVDLGNRTIIGAEALLRWNSPELGQVFPDEFIPVAEECGLIASIGAWVIETACAQIKDWREAGFEMIPISVNVSCFQFTRMDLGQIVTDALSRYDIPPAQLELELTESALLQDNDQTVSCLRELRAVGVKISLDDFGTGYSALSYLSRVPLDVLKMDRAFIRDVHSDPSAFGVASAVVSMAHSLDLHVVAEGVDCAEQIEPLRRMGCDFIQGFIFSAALEAEKFCRYLTPEGLQISIQSIEARAASMVDSASAELPAGRSEVALRSEKLLASEEEHGGFRNRYALVVDDDQTQLGRTALRMNEMGIPSYYARNPEEGVLFALQEPGRIGALLVSSEVNSSDVERVAQHVASQSNEIRPSIVVVGEKFDPAVIADLQLQGPVWSLRIPFDDAELNFVVNAALSKESAADFPERGCVPVHQIVWTRIGDVTGHGVISLLSPRGAFIEMDDLLPVGTAFQLEFSLSDWPVSIRARVVYLVGKDAAGLEHRAGVGVVFLDRDRETGDRIFEEVEKRSARYAF